MQNGQTPFAHQPPGSTILVVDDERPCAELAAALLRSQRFEVQVVTSSAEALARIAAGGIDLVLLDFMMPKLDGADVCAHVRNELANPFLPIIITTSLHDRESRIRAKEAGADDVLMKPLDGLELLVRVESLLRVRRAATALVRERTRLREELAVLRASIECERSAVAVAESVSDAIFGLLDDQHSILEALRERAPAQAKLQEPLSHLLELTTELRHCAECLAGTGTITIKASAGAEAAARKAHRTPRATVAKLRK